MDFQSVHRDKANQPGTDGLKIRPTGRRAAFIEEGLLLVGAVLIFLLLVAVVWFCLSFGSVSAYTEVPPVSMGTAVEKPAQPADDSAVESEDGLPAWIGEKQIEDGHTTLVTLTSREWASVEEAEQNLVEQAKPIVREHFLKTAAADGRHKVTPDDGDWTLPEGVVRFRRRHVEDVERQAGNVTFTMHRLHAQLELTPEVREQVYESWREQTVHRRLRLLGGTLAGLTLALAAAAVWLRREGRGSKVESREPEPRGNTTT